MKKIVVVLIFLCAFTALESKAQFNYIGGGIALSTADNGYKLDGYEYFNKAFGIDVRMSYNFNKKLKIVPDFKIYLPNTDSYEYNHGGFTKTTVFAFNLNAHFILNARSRNSYRLYLLAGGHVSGWNIVDQLETNFVTNDIKEFKFVPGANAGAGMQFHLGTRFLFFAEAKYVISQSHQLVFTPGLLYNF